MPHTSSPTHRAPGTLAPFSGAAPCLGPSSRTPLLQPQSLLVLADVGRLVLGQQLRHELLLVGRRAAISAAREFQGAAQSQPPSRAGDGSPIPPCRLRRLLCSPGR